MRKHFVGLALAATLAAAGIEARGQAPSAGSAPRLQGLGSNPAWNPYFNPALTQNVGRDPAMTYFLASRQVGNMLGPQAAAKAPAEAAAPTRRGMEPAGGASKYYLRPGGQVGSTRGRYGSTRSYYPSVGR